MGRGGPIYLSYTALALLSAPALVSTTSIWHVSIWEGPAPPPNEGPPFDKDAIRNPAVRPYEIIGIVGAYFVSVCIIGTLLLTVGRNLRRKAQEMAAPPREMVKPLPRVMDPSPISPASQRSWYNLRSKKSDNLSVRSGMSPGMDSVVSFDRNVVEADRQRGQEEMERLYAVVMAQDESKSTYQQTVADVPPEYTSRKYPPRLVTDNPSLRHLQGSGPASPQTPKSPYRAIYPPDGDLPAGPMSPRSPIKAEYPNYSMPRDASADSTLRPTREIRTPSYGSGQQSASPQKDSKKLRKSLRNIKISNPIIKDDNSDGLRTPLSPRTYADPGIPPEPPTAGTTQTMDSNMYAPTTPGTARTFPDEYQPETRASESMDEIRALPPAHPQRTGMGAYTYNNQPQAVTNAASTRPNPTKQASSTTNTLPLREMNRQYAAEQARQAAAFPLSPGHWNNTANPLASPGTPGFNNLTSAGPVKTTFVDARKDKLGGGIRTGQATPYSPYMPFTPLTPVTPRLPSRAERKQREKEERKARGALTAEDAVVEEDEMWSSGY